MISFHLTKYAFSSASTLPPRHGWLNVSCISIVVWVVVSSFKYFLFFTPKIGEDEPILTNMLQIGWFNHQPVVLARSRFLGIFLVSYSNIFPQPNQTQ